MQATVPMAASEILKDLHLSDKHDVKGHKPEVGLVICMSTHEELPSVVKIAVWDRDNVRVLLLRCRARARAAVAVCHAARLEDETASYVQ